MTSFTEIEALRLRMESAKKVGSETEILRCLRNLNDALVERESTEAEKPYPAPPLCRPGPAPKCPHTLLQAFNKARTGKLAEASRMCDAIHLWHRDRIAETQDMFLRIQETNRQR